MKKIFSPRYLFSLTLLAGGIIGFMGAGRMNTCTADVSTPRQESLLNNLSLGWGLLVGLLFVIALAVQIPVCRRWLLEQRSDRRLHFPVQVIYFILGIAAIFSLFVTINIPCLASTVWVFVILVGLGLLALGIAFPRLKTRLALSVFSLIFTLVLLEAGTRTYMRLLPIDTSWPILLDEQIGWRHFPNHERIWSGHDPSCVSFRTQMKFNSEGFYDGDHTVEKPEGAIRIAMIGDSFIEAAQVDFEERASRVLEKRLNHEGYQAEVLNFGISNFSVVQDMLTYEAYAAKYQPDFVFIDVFFTRFLRNSRQSGYLIGDETTNTLEIRPVAVLDENNRIQILSPDPEDMQAYEALLQEKFMDADGNLKPHYLYTAPERQAGQGFFENPYQWLVSYSQFTRLISHHINSVWHTYYVSDGTSEINTSTGLSYADYQQGRIFPYESDNELMQLHFILLREFADKVKANGGELILLNYAQTPVYEALHYFAQDNGIGYIDLTAQMANALHDGDVNFLCDSHWNKHGNEVTADAMFMWIQQRLTEPYSIYGTENLTVFEQPDGSWQIYRLQNGQGIFVGQFLPAALSNRGVVVEAEDNWLAVIQPVNDGYQLLLYNPSGDIVDDSFRFGN